MSVSLGWDRAAPGTGTSLRYHHLHSRTLDVCCLSSPAHHLSKRCWPAERLGSSDGTILARHVLMRICSRRKSTASLRGVCHFAKNILPLWRGCAVHSEHGSSEYQIDRHVHPLSASRDGNTHRQGARSEKHGDSLAHAGCPIRLELECCT